MVILVTGGSGFIGSHVVDKLKERKYDVRVFDKAKPLRDDVEWFNGDLMSKEDLLSAMTDAEFVLHLAAVADVYVALQTPELCVQVNEVGTVNLLKAATAKEVDRVILASSTWVYGKAEGEVTEEFPLPAPDSVPDAEPWQVVEAGLAEIIGTRAIAVPVVIADAMGHELRFRLTVSLEALHDE